MVRETKPKVIIRTPKRHRGMVNTSLAIKLVATLDPTISAILKNDKQAAMAKDLNFSNSDKSKVSNEMQSSECPMACTILIIMDKAKKTDEFGTKWSKLKAMDAAPEVTHAESTEVLSFK